MLTNLDLSSGSNCAIITKKYFQNILKIFVKVKKSFNIPNNALVKNPFAS